MATQPPSSPFSLTSTQPFSLSLGGAIRAIADPPTPPPLSTFSLHHVLVVRRQRLVLLMLALASAAVAYAGLFVAHGPLALVSRQQPRQQQQQQPVARGQQHQRYKHQVGGEDAARFAGGLLHDGDRGTESRFSFNPCRDALCLGSAPGFPGPGATCLPKSLLEGGSGVGPYLVAWDRESEKEREGRSLLQASISPSPEWEAEGPADGIAGRTSLLASSFEVAQQMIQEQEQQEQHQQQQQRQRRQQRQQQQQMEQQVQLQKRNEDQVDGVDPDDAPGPPQLLPLPQQWLQQKQMHQKQHVQRRLQGGQGSGVEEQQGPLAASQAALGRTYAGAAPSVAPSAPDAAAAAAASWQWTNEASRCSFRRVEQRDARPMFAGNTVVFAGDSQVRMLAQAFLRLAFPRELLATRVVFRRHSDESFCDPGSGLAVHFLWAPYASNLTHVLSRLQPRTAAVGRYSPSLDDDDDDDAGRGHQQQQRASSSGSRVGADSLSRGSCRQDSQGLNSPESKELRARPNGVGEGEPVCADLVVLGFGLWHMLWVTDAQDYLDGLRAVRASALDVLRASARACWKQRLGRRRRVMERKMSWDLGQRRGKRRHQGSDEAEGTMGFDEAEASEAHLARDTLQHAPSQLSHPHPHLRLLPSAAQHQQEGWQHQRPIHHHHRQQLQLQLQQQPQQVSQLQPQRSMLAEFVGDEGGEEAQLQRRPDEAHGPPMFWLPFPSLLSHKMNTERKRQLFTRSLEEQYRTALTNSGIVWRRKRRRTKEEVNGEEEGEDGGEVDREGNGEATEESIPAVGPEGQWLEQRRAEMVEGGPCLELPLQSLSVACGPMCTPDGMHYAGAVYDATVQVMVNAMGVMGREGLLGPVDVGGRGGAAVGVHGRR